MFRGRVTLYFPPSMAGRLCRPTAATQDGGGPRNEAGSENVKTVPLLAILDPSYFAVTRT